MDRVTSTAPSLRQLTPQTSLLLVVAAGAWVGVAMLARGMGSMPGTMGLGVGSFAAVWALARCRSPLGFVLKLGGYQGRTRDLRVGLYHGSFCLACCWALMALLVAFGLMNVAAMVVLAAAVLVERTWAWGHLFSRGLGIAALGLAIVVVFVPGLAPGLHPMAVPGGMGGM